MSRDARQSVGWWRAASAASPCCAALSLRGAGLALRGAALSLRGAVLALGGAALALGCEGREPQCHGVRCEPLELRVLTWWPNTNNGPATPLVDAANDQHGVSGVALSSRDTKGEMMAMVEDMLLDPDSVDSTQQVDTFLANAGRDVLRWTPCGGGGSRDRLLQLDGPRGYDDLRSRFDPAVLAGVTCCPSRSGCSQPGIYALPLGLHRINHIFYNVERLAGLSPQAVASREDFVQLVQDLGAGGQRVISMPVGDCSALGAGDERALRDCESVAGESLSYLLESLLLLVAQPSGYQSYWRGESWQGSGAAASPESSPDSPPPVSPLGEALELLEALLPYVNNCAPGTLECQAPKTPDDALLDVKDGNAAFLVMPDWYTLDAQREARATVKPLPFPGTSGTFLFMTDVFTVPLAAGTSVEAGLRWVDTLLDPEVQQRFARQKHAQAALADHSQLQLLPSLEAQLPASADPALIRSSLNRWLLAPKADDPGPGLEELMLDEFERAQREGTLRVAPCGDAPCGNL